MRKIIIVFALFMLIPSLAYADETPDPILITVSATSTPQAIAAPATPVPTIRPELPQFVYDEADMRCLSRAIWSITPAHPTRDTKLALCEVVQNRVDDDSGSYRHDVRSALLQKGEFLDYDPEAHRSSENDEIADYSMRSWEAAKLGDRSYRLTPANGTICNFYSNGRYDFIQVFDRSGNLVYDSGVTK